MVKKCKKNDISRKNKLIMSNFAKHHIFAKTLINRINKIKADKNTNLILSADLHTTSEILEIANTLGPKLLGLKLHSDIITDLGKNPRFYEGLSNIANHHNFLIMEDRKFCDIGNTVKLQSTNITKYSDLITVHAISGQGILDGLRESCLKNSCGVLLLAQMSSADNLIDNNYTNQVINLAKNNDDIVVGFIAQEHLDHNFCTFTPGVRLLSNNDNLGQQYNTPQHLVDNNHVDGLIVGRGIYQFTNVLDKAQKYIYTRKMSLRLRMQEQGIIKYGEFTLKFGEKSAVYADFRVLMGKQRLLCDTVIEMMDLANQSLESSNNSNNSNNSNDNIIVGVPLGALPLATVFAQKTNQRMILVRDKPKEYGRQNQIEGLYSKGDSCIVIVDVLTTGGSVLETIQILENCGLIVKQKSGNLLMEK